MHEKLRKALSLACKYSHCGMRKYVLDIHYDTLNPYNSAVRWELGDGKLTEEEQYAAIVDNINSIIFMDNPTEDIQLDAVTRDGSLISFIENPSEKVQIGALRASSRLSGAVLNLISNPSEKVKRAAVKYNEYNMMYINNPSLMVRYTAFFIHPDGEGYLLVRLCLVMIAVLALPLVVAAGAAVVNL